MKKEVFSQKEKHERITIRRRLMQRDVVCEKCGHRIGSLSVNELAEMLEGMGFDRERVDRGLLGEEVRYPD